MQHDSKRATYLAASTRRKLRVSDGSLAQRIEILEQIVRLQPTTEHQRTTHNMTTDGRGGSPFGRWRGGGRGRRPPTADAL